MRVKYGLSSKSKKTFAIHGNYKYFKRRTVGGRVVWKCSKDKELGCCGSIWTRKSTIIFETEHACKGVGELTAIENYQVNVERAKFLAFPPEVQLDVFKCLNFNQLLKTQQTNIYFKNFINVHEKELALKKFQKLHFDRHFNFSLFKPNPRFYEFELSEQLEKKWNCAIEDRMPLFLVSDSFAFYLIEIGTITIQYESRKGVHLKLPNCTTIEEMKIVRHLLQQLFNCYFETICFYGITINPHMIELLFDEDKTNIPLQLRSLSSEHVIQDNSNYFLKFMQNHLISNNLNIEVIEEENKEELFKILTNGGSKFSNIYLGYTELNFYNLIIKHIETTKDFSKMVNKIKFKRVEGNLIISERAENIEKAEDNNGRQHTKFMLSNKYDPEMKFFIYMEGNKMNGFYIEIERIN